MDALTDLTRPAPIDVGRIPADADPLTGLPTRTVLLAEIARRTAAGRPPQLMVLDGDRLRRVNDSLGRDAGDELLRRIALRLQAIVEDPVGIGAGADVVARVGGDRFALLRPDDGGDETAMALAARLAERLAEPHRLRGMDVVVTAGIGIARPQPGGTPEDLLRDAEDALAQAKRQGGGGRALHRPDMRRRGADALALEADLREALATGQLRVAFQPIVDIEDGRTVGLEALARWRHPQRGEVPPGSFIPVAEGCGLIRAVGDAVLRAACTAWAGWRRDGVALPTRLSVNLSRAQLADPTLPGRIRALLAELGLPASMLQLEITESLAMHDASVREALAALRATGLRLSLDDFGTGHSSLASLADFPVQQLKIDRAFVRDLDRAGFPRAVVRACVQLAEALDLDVVAEGVETTAQARELAALGCTRAQGWLYARALEADAVPGFLATPPRRVLTEAEPPPVPPVQAAPREEDDEPAGRGQTLPRRLWWPRAIAMALGGLVVAAALHGAGGGSPVVWAALALHTLVWPQLAYALGRHSANPGQAGRRHLVIDSALTAAWLPAIAFQPLPSVLLLTMLSLQNLSVGGASLFARGLVSQAVGLVAGAALAGVHWQPESSAVTTALSLAFLAAYPMLVGVLTHRLSRQLKRQGAELARAERQQRAVLEAIDAGIALYDADDRLVFWNQSFAQLYAPMAHRIERGMTFERLVRLAIEHGLVPQALDDPDAFVEERVRQHRFSTVPIVRRMADGRTRRIVEQRLPGGGMLAFSTDVTELMRRDD